MTPQVPAEREPGRQQVTAPSEPGQGQVAVPSERDRGQVPAPSEPARQRVPGLPDPRRRPPSAVGRKTWQLIRLIVAGSLLTAGLYHLFGSGSAPGAWLLLIAAGGTWLAVVRMLFQDTAARKFWLIWLGAGLVLTFVTGTGFAARMVALLFAAVFLLFRRYRCYRALTTKQRAGLFFLGVVTFTALTLGWEIGSALADDQSGARGIVAVLSRSAVGALRLFWVFSLLNLFFGMRLRGFRLRTKMAVSALFLSLLPVVLLILFGLMFTYGALGGSRAARTSTLLGAWADQLRANAELDQAPFSHMLEARHAGGTWRSEREVPAWLDDLDEHLGRTPAGTRTEGSGGTPIQGSTQSEPRDGSFAPGQKSPDTPRRSFAPGQESPDTPSRSFAPGQKPAQPPASRHARDGSVQITLSEEVARDHLTGWTPADTTAYVHIREEVWLLRLDGVGSDTLRVRGYEIDKAVLDYLSQLLMCHVGLYSDPGLVVMAAGDTVVTQAVEADSARQVLSIEGTFEGLESETAEKLGFLGNPLGFGVGLQPVLRLGPSGFYHDEILYHLKVSLYGLSLEFVREDYRLNQALLGGLIVAGLLLLVVQGFAFFLGMRIATGITSAVRSLHRGTLRLASGDLNARVDVVNEDEFGDLAHSFNEMALAVRRGREEAVARERLERELETARAIQARLLPDETPIVPGFEITGTSLPSRQVGGDYFDFLQLGENRVGVAIGDVSGKGIPAALLMANLQASLQGQVIHPSSVAETVGRVNDLLVRSTDSQMFATFCYGLLDFGQATFTMTNAGHNPPILCRMDGRVERIESGGLLIGMMPGLNYQQETIEFGPGDVLVLYTDGVTEAEGPMELTDDGGVQRPASEARGAKEVAVAAAAAAAAKAEEESEVPENMFGERRLIETIQQHAHASAAEIREAILKAVDRHAAGVPQSDDVTLVVIKRPAVVG